MVNIVPRCIGHRNLLDQYIAIPIRYKVSRITLSCAGRPWHPIVKLDVQFNSLRGFSLHKRYNLGTYFDNSLYCTFSYLKVTGHAR